MMAIVWCLVLIIGYASAYPDGAPADSCTSMFPTGHNVNAETSQPPFTITTNSTDYSTAILVTLRASNGTYFEGVFIQARRAKCDSSKDIPLGTYNLHTPEAQARLKLLDCALGTGRQNALTHKDKVKKRVLQFIWVPPSEATGTVYFRGTFVKETTEFWMTVSSRFLSTPQGQSDNPEKCPVQTTSGGVSVTPLTYTVSMLFALLLYSFIST